MPIKSKRMIITNSDDMIKAIFFTRIIGLIYWYPFTKNCYHDLFRLLKLDAENSNQYYSFVHQVLKKYFHLPDSLCFFIQKQGKYDNKKIVLQMRKKERKSK